MLERIVEILVALALSLTGAAGAGLGQAADRVGGVDAPAPAVQPAAGHDDPAEEGREVALAQLEANRARIAEALAAAAEHANEAAADGLARAAEAAADGLDRAIDAVSGAGADGHGPSGDLPSPGGLPSVVPPDLPLPPGPPAGRP